MAINFATLAKQVDDTLEFIYPKTHASIVEYDPGETDAQTGPESIQSKIRRMHTELYAGQSSLQESLSNYYTKDDIDDRFYEPIEIVSFTASPAYATYTNSANVTLSWTLDKDPASLEIKVGSATYTPTVTKTGSYTISGLTANTTFTLRVKDAGTNNIAAEWQSKDASLSYYYPNYCGIGDSATAASSASSYVGTELGRTASSFTVNATSGKYIYFACPSNKTPELKYNNVTESFTKLSGTITKNGRDYNVYRNTNPGLGSTTYTFTLS